MKISMKLVCQYTANFFNLPPTSNHLPPLQVENRDSNSRLLVDEDDIGKFRLERVKPWRPKVFFSIRNHKYLCQLFLIHLNTYVMGLWQIEILLILSVRGPSLYVRIIVSYKDDSCADGVKS